MTLNPSSRAQCYGNGSVMEWTDLEVDLSKCFWSTRNPPPWFCGRWRLFPDVTGGISNKPGGFNPESIHPCTLQMCPLLRSCPSSRLLLILWRAIAIFRKFVIQPWHI